MTVLRDDTSSSITFLKYSLVDVVTYSRPYLADCNSLAMRSFSAIKILMLELVALTYALLASTNVIRCLHTSYMITHSSNCTRDTWTSGIGTLRDYTTLCCDSSKDMLFISSSELTSRISISLTAWDLLCFHIWRSRWDDLLVLRHEVDILI